VNDGACEGAIARDQGIEEPFDQLIGTHCGGAPT
jgi:hypothetical protein